MTLFDCQTTASWLVLCRYQNYVRGVWTNLEWVRKLWPKYFGFRLMHFSHLYLRFSFSQIYICICISHFQHLYFSLSRICICAFVYLRLLLFPIVSEWREWPGSCFSATVVTQSQSQRRVNQRCSRCLMVCKEHKMHFLHFAHIALFALCTKRALDLKASAKVAKAPPLHLRSLRIMQWTICRIAETMFSAMFSH